MIIDGSLLRKEMIRRVRFIATLNW